MAKDYQIMVRVEPQMHEQLAQLAKDEDRPVSTYVRRLIQEHLKTTRPKQRIRA